MDNKYVFVSYDANTFMVDSRVRGQLSPSPVEHEGNTVGFNQWILFVKKKLRTFTFIHTQSCPISFPLLPHFHHLILHFSHTGEPLAVTSVVLFPYYIDSSISISPINLFLRSLIIFFV